MPGKGTGLRRPRNRAARLPREWKGVLIEQLANEADFDDAVEALAEAGCPAELLPSRRAVAIYYDSAEFKAVRDRWLRNLERSSEREAIASGMAAGGIEALADMVTFESLDQMYLALTEGGQDVDPTQLAKLAVVVKKNAAEEERAKLKAEIAQLKAEIAEARERGEGTVEAGLDDDTLAYIEQKVKLL